jgi:outer membrane protein insertion porin family
MFYRIAALCIILLICITAVEAEVLNEQIEETLPSDGVSLVVVKAFSGSVKVSSWQRQEVLVKASKTVKDDSSKKAQEYAGKLKVEIERVEDRIEIKTKQPLLSALLSQTRLSVDYDIYVPENLDFDIESMNGAVHVTGSRSGGKIKTVDGDIELRNIAGSVSAEAASGDIYAEVLFDAESVFNTIDGSIDIHIGDDFSVPISVRTVSGSINMTIPDGFSADVDARALSGRVSCDLPFDGSIEERSLRGKISGGGPLLKLRTVDGNIVLAGATHLSPADRTESPREPEREWIQAEIEEEELLGEPEIPYVEAAKTLNPPVIDGKLDDECWRSAGKIESFVWADGVEKPHETTEAYLLWDDRNFYIGLKCYESHVDTIKISNIERDKEAWEDDMVQIFIDTTPDTESGYYHIAVNPIGVVFDQEISSANAAKRRIAKSKLGVKWNSEGLFDTDIRDDVWIIEAGLPFSAMEVEPEESRVAEYEEEVRNIWRFNIYRAERRRGEHTYWSPTYASEDWPHVPARFGELVFTSRRLIAETSVEQLVPSEEVLAIAKITIEGNDRVSQEEILKALGLKPGDLVDVDVLSNAKLRLESLGWFEKVGMELTENGKGVDLVVGIMEKEIISPSEVQIRGSGLFTEEQIADYFNFRPFRTTIEDVDIKCRLIEGLYRVKGYEMISVSNSFISNALVIDIDEGHIDNIEVRGNKKVRTRDIRESLDLEPGMLYRKSEIDKAVHTMRARLPYFREVSWEPGRTDDGLNSVYIDVEESDLIKADVDGIGEFNRVHGLQLGMGSEVKSIYGGSRAYCELSYGFSSKIWNYQLGAEKSWFRKRRTTMGIDVHRITDTNDLELVSDVEHFIAEAILGEAWRDFYQRQGYELNFGQKLTSSTEFGLRYRDDEYTSLEKTNDWSLMNRSYEDDDWYEDFRWAGGRDIRIRQIYRDVDEKYKPENPPIEEGNMKSLIAEYTIDTRNAKDAPTSGWFNTLSVEYSGERLGGDFDFALYQANIRRYNRLSGNQFLAFRVKAGTTDRELSDIHPRRFYLGGIGTLRGYSFKEFAGDKMVLINAEYWIMTGWPLGFGGIGLVFFADSGYAWPYESDMDIDDMKTNIGIGCQLGGLRVNLASPINEKEKETVLSVRIARMF